MPDLDYIIIDESVPPATAEIRDRDGRVLARLIGSA